MHKPRIIVIGSGEHARMTIDNIEEQGVYEIYGLTTDQDSLLNQQIYGYRIICKDSDIAALRSSHPDIVGYVLGVGNMKVRSRLFPWLDQFLEPVNVIHPAAIVSRHACMGKGNLIEAYTKVANGVTIGNHCILNSFSAINHDQNVGDNVLVAGNVSMAGKCIGSNTIIADGASIAFKKSVGANCIVGDGAVVTKDIPDNVIVYGNPARIVRSNDW